jgi:hypothetical protein
VLRLLIGEEQVLPAFDMAGLLTLSSGIGPLAAAIGGFDDQRDSLSR